MRSLFRVLPLLGALFVGLCGVELHSAQVPLGVQGTVYLREAKTRKPLSRVYVTAHSLRGQVLATMRTDREGRYLLADLPRRRIVLTALRPGYYTHRAAGAERFARHSRLLFGLRDDTDGFRPDPRRRHHR